MGMLGLAGIKQADGTYTRGLTPAEHQQVIRSQYAQHGVTSGCEVIASASDMSVTVQPGAAVIPMSATGAVEGPIPQTRIVFDPAPSVGEDYYDIFAACENAPGATAYVSFTKNGSAPDGSIHLDRWVIPSGVTNARAGRSLSMKDYAVAVGVGQSRIVDWIDPVLYGGDATKTRFTQYTASIYLPQDRLLTFKITQTFSAKRGGPRGAFQWIVTSDRLGQIATPVLPYDEWPDSTGPMIGGTYQHQFTIGFPAGWHVVKWDRQQISGGTAVHAQGTAPADNGGVLRPGNRIEVFDIGIHA